MSKVSTMSIIPTLSISLKENRLNCMKYNVHTIIQHKPKEEIQSISKKLSLPVHLMLLNLDGNMNIAMSIRTAAVMGCSNVWVIGRRAYDSRAEVGSKNYIKITKLDTINPVEFFRENNLQPIMIEQGGKALEDFKFKPFQTGPVCFIMGSESHGIPKEWLKLDIPRISISQYGMVRSLNVSIASSIVIYEYLKQWRSARIEV